MSRRFDVEVSLALGADLTADPSTWSWTDITAYCMVREGGVSITRGRRDWQSAAQPSSCTVLVNNSDGRFSRLNPTGAYYGQLTKNTPLRVRADIVDGLLIEDTFTRSVSGGWGTPDVGGAWAVAEGSAADFSVNGSVAIMSHGTIANRATIIDAHVPDQDATVYFRIPVAPTGGSAAVIVDLRCRWTDANNNYYLRVNTNAAGTMAFTLNRVVGGAGVTLATGTSQTLNIAHTYGLRMELNGTSLRGKFWDSTAGAEPAAWDVTATDTNLTTGNLVSVFSIPLSVTNTLPYEIWFDNLDVRTAEPSTRFVGYVSEWPPRWDLSESHHWVSIRADGVLRRLGRGFAVKSDLLRTIAGTAPHAYWALEAGPTATQAARYDGNGVLSLAGTGGGSSSGPPGSAGSWDLSSGGSLAGPTGLAGTTPSFEVAATVLWDTLPTAPGGGAPDTFVIAYADCPSGYVFQVGFLLRYSSASWHINGYVQYPTSGVASLSRFLTAPTILTAGVAKHVRLVVYEGTIGLVDARLFVDGQYVAFNGTGVGTNVVGKPTQVTVNLGADIYGPANTPSISHLTVFAPARETTAVAQQGYTTAALEYLAVNGHTGETAVDRVVRVCGQESVVVDATGVDSVLMGPQVTGTLTDVLREVEASDSGLLVERLTGKLGFDSHTDRENLAVAIALDYAQSHIKPAFEPADDDQATVNDVTVTRSGGASARVVDDDSVTNVGRVDQSVTLSLYTDDQPVHNAGWRVNLGTVGEYRYPTVHLMFHSSASLLTNWLTSTPTCDVGSRVTIDNLPSNMPPDLVDQVIEGYTERINRFEWDVTLNLSPYKPYKIFVLASG